jgi:hypothetical protein
MSKGDPMAEKLPIQLAAIEPELYEDSIDNHFMRIEARKAERETHWFVLSPGMLVGSMDPHTNEIIQSDKRFFTGKKLQGSERKLNGQTLLSVRSIHLPKDMSEEGVDEFFNDIGRTPELRRAFGFVAINEPGFPLVQPIKTEVSAYFETESTGKTLAAEAIRLYLNDPESFEHSVDKKQMSVDMSTTYKGLERHEEHMFHLLHELLKDKKKIIHTEK